MGFSVEENIHESESTRTLLAKASQLNMYIHNIHLHIFSIKLISPVIAVYKQTVFPISLNCPTIPYKNFGGYPWKKIEKNIHENRLLCCNLYIVNPIIYQPIMVQLHIFIFFESLRDICHFSRMPIQISVHFGVPISLQVAARNRAWCLVS